MRNPVFFLMLCLVALLAAPPASAQDIQVIPPSGKWVTDNADMLTPDEEQTLSQKLAFYADSTSTQIVVVTLPSLGGADPIMYATELGRVWKVGQAGKNNGVVMLIGRDDRSITIATGYGLEGSITDFQASSIRRNIMVPAFREGRFYEGISAAVDALIAAAKGEFKADEPGGVAHPRRGTDLATLLVLVIIFVFVASALRGNRRGGGGGRGGMRRHSGFPPVIIFGGGGWGHGGGGGFGGFGGGGGGGFGGFGGGGGSFGGGGASGNW